MIGWKQTSSVFTCSLVRNVARLASPIHEMVGLVRIQKEQLKTELQR
jgi:hypothetical protein